MPEKFGGKIGLDAQFHRHCGVGRSGQRAHCGGPVAAQGAGMGVKAQTLGGKIGTSAGPLEQARAKLRLQRRNAGGHGTLRDAKAFGRAVEAAGVHKVEKGVEKVDLHEAPLIGISDQ